ncbi:TetR/AcrR family transcriptional regulator [Corynebacterium pygosceleis]|uniref:TetR/AcrR family transcriptional regulator n=1 Tax=Corynebacterium pygosceleis TaxID=2800406 RepID=A0A9Q4CA52_9CORY|nr:TetR/AcrR family transcriptional regulator [Corynebacterium pygosceleis]MCK7638447.1 TetR/AcrR family transcriptional regulator [Corynebacterium pygosceleis]MCK7675427.1 TetR/AcrR family transcriptional regulator [Corynebacterium pygosceleis]MCL0121179.1 TetR/AcrR family transcriptional regulator [Corynebacterium pygosceleis]MCX7469111.1 TetR/AcrR family transcriptional regulator [Corynebacterium pygosceleis]
MRPSRRDHILTSAIALIEEHGLNAVSLESVAERAGISKGGLMYHFPTRQELLLGIVGSLADDWEEQLRELAGGTADSVDADTRLRAYVLSMATSVTRAELMLTLETTQNPDLGDAWQPVLSRWAPDVSDTDTEAGRLRYLKVLAAEGLWLHDALDHRTMTARQRTSMTEAILNLGTADPD